jgi:hypothetical protein
MIELRVDLQTPPQRAESLLAALQSRTRHGQNDFIAFNKLDPTGRHSKQEDDS